MTTMREWQAMTELERFWARVQKSDTCWTWTGEVNNKGYGRFATWVGGRTRHLAHRYSARLAGMHIDGWVLLHICDNPPCVNPDHLRPGTQADNLRDAHAKGRTNIAGLEIGQRMSKRGRKRKATL